MNGYAADTAETCLAVTSEATFAYRRLGASSGVPLLLASRFRGTIDHWDPQLLDQLAREREVIVFDNAGVNLSTGVVPDSIGGMAQDLLRFVEALNLTQVDIMGWSMGGMIALSAVLERRDLFRRVIIAASSPGPVPGTPPRDPAAGEVAGRAVNSDEDFLYLFFPDTASAQTLGGPRCGGWTPACTNHAQP